MPYKIKDNANALLESTASTNAQIEVTRISLLRSKLPKFDGRTDKQEGSEMDNIVVENLVYTGKEPIFSGEFSIS